MKTIACAGMLFVLATCAQYVDSMGDNEVEFRDLAKDMASDAFSEAASLNSDDANFEGVLDSKAPFNARDAFEIFDSAPNEYIPSLDEVIKYATDMDSVYEVIINAARIALERGARNELKSMLSTAKQCDVCKVCFLQDEPLGMDCYDDDCPHNQEESK